MKDVERLLAATETRDGDVAGVIDAVGVDAAARLLFLRSPASVACCTHAGGRVL
ncbi:MULTISPECIES: hypothetical protein [Thermomonosporaceae]|uniref:hypothetical protein n=1 Tax=Thermomonosporaceae TaxID=2012 RepID=UPI00255AC5EF|nr:MULTISPECIES: hypothetical protein [Thermomonosporaceae]MDL4770770.1 hypothetical protein [Actinomadura xylanilytica]